MKRGWFVAIVLMAALLLIAYRILFTDQVVPVQPWYEGQDITEGDDPLPFNAQSGSRLVYPQRDAFGALPSDVYRDYIDSASRDYFDLGLLTDSSQALFVNAGPSREQLRNSVAVYRECEGPEEGANGDFAVLLFPPTERLCDPVLFKREQGLWKIDLASMREEIGHNHHNQWHFSRVEPPADYAFAFEGWQFDAKGYPVLR